MKKIIGLVASIVVLITLSACGIEKTKTFVGEKDNVKMEVTYTYKGDKVIKQKSVNTLKYSDFGFNDDTSKKMQDIKGVKESIKENDEGLVETTTIDLKNADMTTLEAEGIISTSDNKGKGFSMKKTEKKMKKDGFKEKED
ncbi:DUF1307 domain-containing protein [Staphylococcus epidermidis]|uniref:DUF1307 domain-containing protein n=2 Tax=Staphylococcus epidermidis TaxID=1282 RepID=UPI0001A960A6|nr:DUF1307 domain-containing protein [Staphylococcus epidermidis]EES36579.1 hypothetical protein HMPREF0791_0837 [Staphylococcus epidermidis W23144]EJD89044.1 hypothetical protein HMPREF9990_05769 [Staphylococcus epidermidis NIHLM061]MBF2226251.1 DUF1307 domain-containing protein [Staphylococcus epidermidis]MBF2334224.1 DUF1307 domain-containing protein [Staphylococcus epidermidis]MBF2339112.1 DUF1307 domain-containing protein [Staphylococcus epidermidis]